MSERNVYHTPETRVLLRTDDVFQTEGSDDVSSYSERLLALVADFKNSGIPEGANAQAMVGKSKRGEVACQLYARINPETRIIEAAGFKTRGCLAMTGCASAACMLIEGKTLDEALAVSLDDIRSFVDDVPAGKVNALYFAACAIQALVADYLFEEDASLADIAAAVPCDENSIACIMAEHCSLRQAKLEKHEQEATVKRALAQNNACADVFNLVRERSAKSLLTCAADWDNLVPAHLMPAEFIDVVLGALEPESELPAPTFNLAETDTPISQPSAFANRGVGIPHMFAAQDDDGDSDEPTASAHEMPETKRVYDYDMSTIIDDDDDFELVPPEGYKLVCIDGEWGLVPTDAPPAERPRQVDATGIVALTGTATTYLYDSTTMQPNFARWAFLAAEDNPLVTFAYCVREDSRVYPRPMAEECFANHPLNMDAATVQSIWEQIQTLSDYADLKRVEASNGDVYYYSTAYLTPEHAQSLAEWNSVERLMSV